MPYQQVSLKPPSSERVQYVPAVAGLSIAGASVSVKALIELSVAPASIITQFLSSSKQMPVKSPSAAAVAQVHCAPIAQPVKS